MVTLTLLSGMLPPRVDHGWQLPDVHGKTLPRGKAVPMAAHALRLQVGTAN